MRRARIARTESKPWLVDARRMHDMAAMENRRAAVGAHSCALWRARVIPRRL